MAIGERPDRINIKDLFQPWEPRETESTSTPTSDGPAADRQRIDLAQLLTGLSLFAWQFLDRAEAAGFSPREETISETLLVEMTSQAPQRVLVHKTSTAEEVQTGADFAWAINIDGSLWLNLLVQAKKLNCRSRMYQELRGESAITQAINLLAEAAGSEAVPLYLFYNGRSLGDDGALLELNACSRGSLVRGSEGPLWASHGSQTPAGCTVAAAEAVKELLLDGRARDLSEVRRIAAPWECLLCPVIGGRGRPTMLPWPDKSVGPDAPDRGTNIPWLREAPPQWAAMLLEGENPEDDPRAPAARYFTVLRA